MLIRWRRNEEGIALASVLITALVMMSLVGGTVAFAINSQDLSRRDQDWNAALAAADAGIDDYIYRLNRQDAYWQWNETNPDPNNDAFIDWVQVPGGANEGRYRYRVDTSTFASDGTIKIAATGRVNRSTRTAYAVLRKESFLDFLYFTDYETVDPVLYPPGNDEGEADWAEDNCVKWYWESPRDPDCTDIHFFERDIIEGPLHSNDALLITGEATFNGKTTTGWPNNPDGTEPDPRYRDGGGGEPNFIRDGDPADGGILEIPPSNTSMKTLTDTTPGATGCLYTGPTQIVLENASPGRMDVYSPRTPSSGPNMPPRYAQCVGTNRPLPANGVIYVQNRPTGGSWGNCPTGNHPLRSLPSGFPQLFYSGDVTPYWTNAKCAGDAFVQGTLRGRLTIAAENNVIVTDDILYADGGSGTADMLGLVANNFVEIFHPVNSNENELSGTRMFDLTVHAAILSVTHSFRVQNWRDGSPRGELTVLGAIAQQFRGAVGTFSSSSGNTVSGYEKRYGYDDRLQFLAPPYFLDPVRAAWVVKDWAEVPPCYPNGDDYDAPRDQAPCNQDTPPT